ncbi:hypothetical protein [Croceicoccus gelatinilyticus]|uniref:hypothetical protein n=1 Tax=Croceicoccus gelatinilyticus TaxID=2835536 RepID=UPI001BD05715|nr:hypothetical protein [Croceicoccus gelatinilyticus]MBS7671387.1 hypothetical protein [Croceicoccus gelatinilyticus]
MTTNPLPVVLDRLEKALGVQGVKLKRSQVLEIAAMAFGFRNSNALTAACKAGDINPPMARPIGRLRDIEGDNLIVARDPIANATYSIDESFLEQVAAEERAEEFGISPYGHLLNLADLLDLNIDDIETGVTEVHVGRISHKHGGDFYIATDDDGLEIQLAAYCRENWDDLSHCDQAQECDLDTMDASEIVETYFELHGDEHLDRSVEQVVGGKVRGLPFNNLPERAKILELADNLDGGVSADIWYDAHEYGADAPEDPDRLAENRIETTMNAMTGAAGVLRLVAASQA